VEGVEGIIKIVTGEEENDVEQYGGEADEVEAKDVREEKRGLTHRYRNACSLQIQDQPMPLCRTVELMHGQIGGGAVSLVSFLLGNYPHFAVI